jgi:flagellar protein FlaG
MNIDALIAQSSTLPRQAQDATAVKAVAAPAPAPVAQSRPAAAPTMDQVRAASEQIEKYLKSSGRALDFHVDSDSGLVVVVVRDSESGDVIRQIPSEEALRLAQSLGDGVISLVTAVA